MRSRSCSIGAWRICTWTAALLLSTAASAQCPGEGSYCDDFGSQDDCDAIGGIFQGGGTACADIVCKGLGACCFRDPYYGSATCEDGMTEDECEVSYGYFGGEYQGDGTACDTVTCPDNAVGACCIRDYSGGPDACVDGFTELGCQYYLYYGTYQGDGTSCADEPCAEPVGACCLQGVYYDDLCLDGVIETECLYFYDYNEYYDSVIWIRGADCADNPCGFLPCPGEGSCLDPDGNGTPGCEDEKCCETVCIELDPFCCKTLWDSICAGLAFEFCTFLCGADTNGDGLVNVTDLINAINDWGTDGSANGGDTNRDGTVDVTDLVNVITQWGRCPRTL